MKKRSVPFAIITFIWLLAGLATGSNICYIFFLSMAFIAVIGLLSLVVSWVQIECVQKVTPKFGIKGQTVVLEMQIRNRYFFPLPYIEIEYDLPDERFDLYAYKESLGVNALSCASVKKNVYCMYMGKWPIGLSRIKVYDIFGLFCFTADLYKKRMLRPLTLVIKPRIVFIESLPLPLKENSSNQNSTQKNTFDVAEINEIKEYNQGDPLKKIHWKLSLAKQELMVKNFSLSLEADTLIYVDCSSHGFTGIRSVRLEDMIAECAVAIASHLLNSHLPASLTVLGKERKVLSGRTPEDFYAMYESISNISFDYDFSFFDMFSHDMPSFTNINSIFLITHSIDPKAFDCLVYLKKASININLILVKEPDIEHDMQTRKIISELSFAGVVIIEVYSGDDLNICIKEQTYEKPAL